jgi:hypothetical protein
VKVVSVNSQPSQVVVVAEAIATDKAMMDLLSICTGFGHNKLLTEFIMESELK